MTDFSPEEYETAADRWHRINPSFSAFCSIRARELREEK